MLNQHLKRLTTICLLKLPPSVRCGVEDTRLEAKAKDTKKFRGQGQTLSRPRTKDTDASVLKKKKGFQKVFVGRSLFEETKKKVFADFSQGFWRFPTKF